MSVAHPLTAADAYHELCSYTLAHGDPTFIHQHVVDAYAAQNADERTRPIALTFALVGLHLHVDKQYSGKQVRCAHQQLAAKCRAWPVLNVPVSRGAMTSIDVMAVEPGPDRDRAIDAWCAAVWAAFGDSQPVIRQLARDHGIG